jgi:hypothetical protein
LHFEGEVGEIMVLELPVPLSSGLHFKLIARMIADLAKIVKRNTSKSSIPFHTVKYGRFYNYLDILKRRG